MVNETVVTCMEGRVSRPSTVSLMHNQVLKVLMGNEPVATKSM